MDYFIVYVLVTWAVVAYRLSRLGDNGLRPLPLWLRFLVFGIAPIAMPLGFVSYLARLMTGASPHSWEEQASRINTLQDKLNKLYE